MTTPNIPVHLAHRPTTGGLVVPVITARTHDGRPALGVVAEHLRVACLRRRLCAVCGHPIEQTGVLYARESDLAYECTDEPAVCPPCHAYTRTACPHLAGRARRLRGTVRDDLPGVPVAHTDARLGAPAEPYYAIYVHAYAVIDDPRLPGVLAASWAGCAERIRPLSTTGQPSGRPQAGHQRREAVTAFQKLTGDHT